MGADNWISLASLAVALAAIVLTYLTVRAMRQQATAMGSSAVVDVREICLHYFDYRFNDPVVDRDRVAGLHTIKEFRQHWARELPNLSPEDQHWFSDQVASQHAGSVGSALYQISIELNRLGAACMISRPVLDFTLALQAKVILQDYAMLRQFLTKDYWGPEAPGRMDRRAAFWLVHVCELFLRGTLPETYDRVVSEELQNMFRAKSFDELIVKIDRIDGVLIDPGVRKRVRSLRKRLDKAA